MSDTSQDTSAQPNPPAAGDAAASSRPVQVPYQILMQYVKDLSFENPAAPLLFLQEGSRRPEVTFKIDVTTNAMPNSLVEVVLHIEANAVFEGKSCYVIEVAYAAVVQIGAINPEALQALLLIEVPRQLWPAARHYVANLTGDGGYSTILMAPVDFIRLFQMKTGKDISIQRPAPTPAADTSAA